MLSDRALLALLDIRDNIEAARRFVSGMTFEQFNESQLHFYGTTRALEIVSEAARRLGEEFRKAHPSLPWKKIMGVGNVYRHNYENVVEEIVWKTVREDLEPRLCVVVAAIDDHRP